MTDRKPTELEICARRLYDEGKAWCEAKLKHELLEKDKDSFLSALIGELRKADPEASEKRLETDAKASEQYRAYIRGMVLAQNAALVARVRYDATDKLFSAKQSDQSLERAKLERNIYHEGR